MNNIVLTQDGTRSEEQKDAAQVESYVAQRYVENPYLINGNKVNEKYKFYCKSNSEKSSNVPINNLTKTNNGQIVDRRTSE